MNVWGLTVLSLTLAFAVVMEGGVWPRDWNVCLLAIALLTLIYRLRDRSDQAPPVPRKSQWLVLAFAILAVAQILPLPLSVVHLLSPARANLLTATIPVLGAAWFTPLSTSPAATVEHLMRFGGYLLVFLLVRDLAWRLRDSPWLPALPLLGVATFEAALGLIQSYSPGSDGFPSGTYVNHNHFAGFLEMCLPFAVLYLVAILRRPRSPLSPAPPAWKTCGLLSVAALILVAILHSLSRMGFLATLGSLLFVAALALGARRHGWKRWLPIGSVVVLTVLAFIFLPSDPLIARYAQLAPADAISSDMRTGMWRDALGVIKAFPLFGCGLGAYESCFPRFQLVAPMNTIDFAHNDYLQYLAELGAPAFLAGLLFMLGVFRRTVHSGMDQPSTDRRYVALACAGSFAAIILHSFVDFNLYIPANAMLLAWIAGIAAGSKTGTGSNFAASAKLRACPRFANRGLLWPVAMCAAIILAASSAHSLWSHAAPPSPQQALRQDPASPYRWCDLAEAFQQEGQRDQARYCFQQARKLAPNIPPIWMRATFFYLQGEETAAALDSSARVLRIVPDYDDVIFNYYDRFVPTVAEVLPYLADNSRAGRAYFHHLLKSATTEDAAVAWTWLRDRSFSQDQLAVEYLDFLLRHRESGEAVKVWASYLAARRGDYPVPNLIFNGDFENEPTGAALDWRITAIPGVDTGRDEHSARTGTYSLHIAFHGTENVHYHHTAQMVGVRPGEYRFRAFVRTRELTTDEGLRFHIFDPESGARLDVYTEQLTGTNDWTPLEKTLTVPPGTNLIAVQVSRIPSEKFDNKIDGEAWADTVSLTRILKRPNERQHF